MKKFINGIIVVEGSHDISRISEVYDVLDFVETNGYSINIKDILYLKSITKHKIIVLTDPDNAGGAIRKTLNDNIEGLINLNVDINKCNKNNKHGIAECLLSEIREKLEPFISENKPHDEISKAELYSLGLIGAKNSKEKREFLSDQYNLGNCNINTFIRRCTIKNIKLKELANGNQ